MPGVSVVVPVFNPGQVLRRSIESVLAQTYADFECIVVDDGSTEDVSWVADLDDGRVRLVRQANRGVSVARNVGVAAASSTYVAFLDQDDEWLPDKLERQMTSVDAHPDAAFWCTRFVWVSASDSRESDPTSPTYLGLLADQHVCLSSTVVNRRAYDEIGGHDPLLSQMQDYDLFLRLAMVAPPPVLVNEPLVRYHLHGDNASRNYDIAAQERLSVLARHHARAQDLGLWDVTRAIARGRARTRELYSLQALDRGRAARQEGDLGAAWHHLGAAAAFRPATLLNAVPQAIKARAGGLTRVLRRSRSLSRP